MITSGQPLVVLEAMKMENEVRAHTSGTIMKIFVSKGESVDKGALLVRIGATVPE
jgi:pyruvate carboxylase subunit B